jgi:hypothetical protein
VTGRIAVIDDEAPNRAYLQTLLGTAGPRRGLSSVERK